MNVGSTFSGVGGFDLGFERAGMSVLWQAEIDDWCRRVLRNHWPQATIYDDVRAVGSGAAPVDLLCGGFPCQDLSVAGKRLGFEGERSSLFFEFARIADELRPRWIVLENVVGLLSSAEGRDFGILLATLADLGYGVGWRVVDARYFGVPQQRRRVFIVGCLRDDGERAVRAVGAGGEGDLKAGDCSWLSPDAKLSDGIKPGGSARPFVQQRVAKCLTTKRRHDAQFETYVDSGANSVVETEKLSKAPLAGSPRCDAETETFITSTQKVRRLTPIESERLMSWPDGWTAIDGDKTPDSKRYAACGNGVVANVSEWIGRRIMAIDYAVDGINASLSKGDQ